MIFYQKFLFIIFNSFFIYKKLKNKNKRKSCRIKVLKMFHKLIMDSLNMVETVQMLLSVRVINQLKQIKPKI